MTSELVNCKRNVVVVPNEHDAMTLEQKRDAALAALRVAGKYGPDRVVKRLADKSHALKDIESKGMKKLPVNVVKIHGHSQR